MAKDIDDIKNSKIWVRADKTNNFYKIEPLNYKIIRNKIIFAYKLVRYNTLNPSKTELGIIFLNIFKNIVSNVQNICRCKMATSIDLLIDQALFWHHLVLKCRQNCINDN